MASLSAQQAVEIAGHRYEWDPRWGRPVAASALGRDGEGEVELGNTHGCIVLRNNGNLLANTDTEHAVIEFTPDGRIVSTWGKQFHG
ncbi:MAG TPA: hypothetical protein ENI87_01225, partial [bacterium]|nr:hypothetical protein [bacterium]